MKDLHTVFSQIDRLVDQWCERRRLKPLRLILSSYPLANGLTDEWQSLLSALEDIKGLCQAEMTADEKRLLLEVISAIREILSAQG